MLNKTPLRWISVYVYMEHIHVWWWQEENTIEEEPSFCTLILCWLAEAVFKIGKSIVFCTEPKNITVGREMNLRGIRMQLLILLRLLIPLICNLRSELNSLNFWPGRVGLQAEAIYRGLKKQWKINKYEINGMKICYKLAGPAINNTLI